MRERVNKVMELARNDKVVGAGLDARVLVHATDATLAARLTAMAAETAGGVDELRYLCIVSQAVVVDASADVVEACGKYVAQGEPVEGFGQITAGVAPAEGTKCERCWNFSTNVGECKEHPTLCKRCVPVILDKGVVAPVPV